MSQSPSTNPSSNISTNTNTINSSVVASRTRSRTRSGSLLGLKISKQYQQQQQQQQSINLRKSWNDVHLFSTQIGDYEILEGQGITEDISHAYLARHLPSQKMVTLKLTDLQISQDYELVLEMIDIVKNTRMCRNDYIVSYYSSFIENERLWTIMEPIKIPSCKQMLSNYYPDGILNEHVISTMLRDVAKAIVYLHQNHYIHNNIRADNIMINAEGNVLLGGLYQMTSLLDSGRLKRSIFTYVGDAEWMAPEVLSQATTFNERIDIYSFGITAQELMYGKTPFDGWSPLKILLAKLQYQIPEMTSDIKTPSKHFMKLVEKCLSKSPMLRPSAQALLEDVFMKTAKNAHYIETQLLKRLGRVSTYGNGSSIDDPMSPLSIRSEPATTGE